MNFGISIILKKNQLKMSLNFLSQLSLQDQRQDPEKYYKKASILCMTSSFEGFGLVLVEAQTYGVVPVAFNSFSSVTDVIHNGETGFLVEPFNEESYVEILSDLMSNNNLLRSISINCEKSAKRFELGDIGNQWLEMFVHLRS